MKKLNSIQQREVLLEVVEQLNPYSEFICNVTLIVLNNDYVVEGDKYKYTSYILETYMPAFRKYIIDEGDKLGNRHWSAWIKPANKYRDIEDWIEFKKLKIRQYIKRLDVRIAKYKKI